MGKLSELDLMRLRQVSLRLREGTSWIAEIEAKERENSGISTLKIDYNKKDGYYFHVTNSQLGNVPAHFFRQGDAEKLQNALEPKN